MGLNAPIDAELIQLLTPEELAELDALLAAQDQIDAYDWDRHCLPYQRLPHNLSDCPWVSREWGAGAVGNEDFNTILWCCGRGAGKTTTITHNVCKLVEQGRYKRIGIVAPTERIYRESIALPIVDASPDWCKAVYRANESKIVWANGATAQLLSAEKPRLIRSWNFDTLVLDEVVAWQYPECYALARACLRVGEEPLTLIGTTPMSTPLIWSILRSPNTAVINASTYDNTTLSKQALAALIEPYLGHPDYDQEILGRIHERIAGALWTAETIGGKRIIALPEGVTLVRVVVGVDPGGFGSDGDEAGIVVVGKGSEGRYYVLADYSLQGQPDAVAKAMVAAYNDYFADAMVYETNQGGNWIRALVDTIDPTINLVGVHAKQGKRLRAEPISALYNRGEVSHIGTHEALEAQMRKWIPGKGSSPDRIDGLVYGITNLSGKGREVKFY